MSQFTRTRIGKAGTPEDPSGRPSLDNNTAGTYLYPPQLGCPTTPSIAFNVVPATKQAANVAALQTPTGASNLTLAAGTSATATTVQGVSVIALDCARCVSIVGQVGVVQRTYTITGYDDYQQAMTQTITGPNGNQTITTTKAFRYVTSISVSGGTTAAISVGTSDTIGLGYYAPYFESIDIFYGGADITASTGFTAADTTSPATASTGDVRGTYALQVAANGSNRLMVTTLLLSPDNVNTVWGLPQV